MALLDVGGFVIRLADVLAERGDGVCRAHCRFRGAVIVHWVLSSLEIFVAAPPAHEWHSKHDETHNSEPNDLAQTSIEQVQEHLSDAKWGDVNLSGASASRGTPACRSAEELKVSESIHEMGSSEIDWHIY